MIPTAPGKESASKVFIVLIIGLVLVPAAIGPVAAQETAGNETTTTTTPAQTQTGEACEIGPNDPNLRQAGLHTTDDRITVDSPAEIAGQFRLSAASQCSVHVAVTLTVPNGMYIEGGQNLEGSSSGLATGEFVVDGGDPKEVRGTVHSTVARDQIITADVEYWPVGHPDEVKTQTYRMQIVVEEPNARETPSQDQVNNESGAVQAGGDGNTPDEIPLEFLHIGLIGIALVGLIAIGYKGATAEVVNKFIKR